MSTPTIYRGHVKKGQIALDDPIQLTEGAEVVVLLVEQTEATIWEKLRSIAGTVEGPKDWAQNHDHYIHGTPERS